MRYLLLWLFEKSTILLVFALTNCFYYFLSLIEFSSYIPKIGKKMKNSSDPTWKHNHHVSESHLQVKCNYCKKQILGGCSRMKHNLAGTWQNSMECPLMFGCCWRKFLSLWNQKLKDLLDGDATHWCRSGKGKKSMRNLDFFIINSRAPKAGKMRQKWQKTERDNEGLRCYLHQYLSLWACIGPLIQCDELFISEMI